MRGALARSIEPSKDAARGALAVAIADVARAEKRLSTARSSEEAATDRLYAASRELEQFEEQPPASPQDTGELAKAFAASVDSGQVFDVDVLDRQRLTNDEALRKAQRAVEVWRATRDSARIVVRESEDAVTKAKAAVVSAVVNVVRQSDSVAELLDGIAELQSKLFARRLALHFLAQKDMVGDADKDAVMAALAPLPLPGRPADIYYEAWHGQRPYTDWAAAVAGLTRDAQTPLPTLSKATETR